MNIWLKIGKHSSSIGCILILLVFLMILPLRSLSLSQSFPSYFQVPFSEDSRWIFILIGIAPITILGLPLYYLHKKHEKWEKTQSHERIVKEIEKLKIKEKR